MAFASHRPCTSSTTENIGRPPRDGSRTTVFCSPASAGSRPGRHQPEPDSGPACVIRLWRAYPRRLTFRPRSPDAGRPARSWPCAARHGAPTQRGRGYARSEPGFAATASTAPVWPWWPGRIGRAGGQRDAATPATGIARRSATSAQQCDRPRPHPGSRRRAGRRLSPRHQHRPPHETNAGRSRAGS